MVQGIIAGGDRAIRHPVEGAEDDEEAGYKVITETLTAQDTLIAISASGGAPYVIGALKAAKDKGCKTIAMANNPDALSFKYAEHYIFLDTGAEILAGSTRLKAGTAQKITLNMISTGLMVKLGKVIGNLMVDVQATNAKLKKRAIELVKHLTNCSEAEAIQALENSQYRVKKAIKWLSDGVSG
jgi:N-acetylmuramic acid 6-phosphate etherase